MNLTWKFVSLVCFISVMNNWFRIFLCQEFSFMWNVRISRIFTLMHKVANSRKKIVAFDHKCGILWLLFYYRVLWQNDLLATASEILEQIAKESDYFLVQLTNADCDIVDKKNKQIRLGDKRAFKWNMRRGFTRKPWTTIVKPEKL